jgi:hypothetical protein
MCKVYSNLPAAMTSMATMVATDGEKKDAETKSESF